jgi:hypothetical protein
MYFRRLKRAKYIGVVILAFSASSVEVSSPLGLRLDSRANRTSVGICRRDFVNAKTFRSKPPFLTGRLKKKKMHMEKKRIFSPREVASGSGFVGGRVRRAVLTAR